MPASRSTVVLLGGAPSSSAAGLSRPAPPHRPGADEAADLLRTGLQAIPSERLWVNPGCGLKTRGRPETRAALRNLVAAARTVRGELSAS